MNKVIKDLILKFLPQNTRYNWAISLMNSIGYGETSIVSETKQFLSIIQKLKIEKPCILDIGSSFGNYTFELLSQNNDIIVHAYEPSLAAYESSREYLREYLKINRCYIHNFGIGEKSKIANLYANYQGSPGASLNRRKGNDHQKTLVKILNFNAAIARIKLPIVGMKIDTEGQEWSILCSAKNLLQQKDFRVLQFEFGEYTIEKQESFKQYYEYLSNLGFKVFRMSKFGMAEIKEYTPRLEIHWNTSYLAVKNESKLNSL
jgi:FkbM family methyltransferase